MTANSHVRCALSLAPAAASNSRARHTLLCNFVRAGRLAVGRIDIKREDVSGLQHGVEVCRMVLVPHHSQEVTSIRSCCPGAQWAALLDAVQRYKARVVC